MYISISANVFPFVQLYHLERPMANSLLRPPQANNDAPSRVAPVVVSGLGVVTLFIGGGYV
jgi:uncharacterized membrane protein YhiD involved in acid resistance